MSRRLENTPMATVYNYIYDEILNRNLKPGQTLTESSLCEILQVGRSPVRKALQELAKDGFVVVYSNRGAFVEHFSRKQISQLYSLRGTFLEYALEQSMILFDEKDYDYLNDCLSREAAAFEKRAFGDYTEAVKSFYSYIIDKADNPYLSEIASVILNRINVYLCLYDNFYQVKKLKSPQVHKKIIQYIKEGNVKAVMRTYRRFCSDMESLYDFNVKKNIENE